MLCSRAFALLFVLPSSIVAQDLFSGLVHYIFPSWKSKTEEAVKTAFLELGIGDHAYDSSNIINITDLNWKDFWGPEASGEWLVEFTARPDHCASCELVDFAFNVVLPLTQSNNQDASHRMNAVHPDVKIGRVDCSEQIILSTRFLITRPPFLYHISPSTRSVRKLPQELARPADLVAYYTERGWRIVDEWTGPLNPLGEGPFPLLVDYVGRALKVYTRLVDNVPYASSWSPI